MFEYEQGGRIRSWQGLYGLLAVKEGRRISSFERDVHMVQIVSNRQV